MALNAEEFLGMAGEAGASPFTFSAMCECGTENTFRLPQLIDELLSPKFAKYAAGLKCAECSAPMPADVTMLFAKFSHHLLKHTLSGVNYALGATIASAIETALLDTKNLERVLDFVNRMENYADAAREKYDCPYGGSLLDSHARTARMVISNAKKEGG